MRFFLLFLLFKGILLTTACRLGELDDDPPVFTTAATASPTPTEPLTTTEVPTSPASLATASPTPNEEAAVPAEVTVAPDASLPTRGDSIAPQISGDGRWVAFWSWAGNLIPEDSERCRENEAMNYSCGDVYVLDRESGQIERILVGEAYGLGMGIYFLILSADGNRLAFNCQIYERQTTYQLLHSERCGQISGDGQFVAFQQGADFFVQELASGSVMQISVANDGTPSNEEPINFETPFEGERFNPGLDISENARWVVFASTASNLDPADTHICDDPFFEPHNCYDIYLHDHETGRTEWISKPHRIN